MKQWIVRIAHAFVFASAGLFIAGAAEAEIKTKTITYNDGATTLKGVLAWDDARSGKRPGVLVMSEWWGVNAANKERARRVAEAGYVAFAPDMYGDGKTTGDKKEAGTLMGEVINDTAKWNRRAQLALDVLKADPMVDGKRLAALGSSFGGLTAIQMAYAGHDIKAAISIASHLPPAPDTVTSIKPRMLVFVGADDTFYKPGAIDAFQAGLKRVKADWELITYSKARHSFATPDAGTHGMDNLAYNKMADERSWTAMMTLLHDALK